MLHNISTVILFFILIYHGYQYYERKMLQRSIAVYMENNSNTTNTEQVPKQGQIIKVNDEMYVATGFALGNSIILIGETGLVVIDTTESKQGASEICREIRKLTSKPLKGIIYTHMHPDHVLGTHEFLSLTDSTSDDKNDEDNDENRNDRYKNDESDNMNENNEYKTNGDIQIWAYHTLPDLFFRFTRMLAPNRFYRGMHQFGYFLTSGHESAGIGRRLRLDGSQRRRLVLPNRLMYKDEERISIAGIELVLMHVPGETDDQICAFWPKHNALLGSDNLYKAFPNLYAIRGTPFRSLKKWFESLDKMRALKPNYFLMSHHKPLIGKDNIYRIMTNYRDAVQHVHDQTVRFVNQNMHPDEISSRIKLPVILREEPYLKELYGTVAWSSKALFDGYMGWYSGDITELDQLTSLERGKRLVTLAGGLEKLTKHAEVALDKSDPKWALFLSSAAEHVKPGNLRIKEVKAKACIMLSNQQTSYNGINYYRTAAHVTTCAIKVNLNKENFNAALRTTPVNDFFYLLSLRFRTEVCADVNQLVKFVFPDLRREYVFQIRNGIMDTSGVYERSDEDIKITVKYLTLLDVLTRHRNPIIPILTSELKVEPSIWDLRHLIFCFSVE